MCGGLPFSNPKISYSKVGILVSMTVSDSKVGGFSMTVSDLKSESLTSEQRNFERST
jgi:hypothetical protein